jgi:hypothetical protein
LADRSVQAWAQTAEEDRSVIAGQVVDILAATAAAIRALPQPLLTTGR